MTKNRFVRSLSSVATTSALLLSFFAASVRPARAQDTTSSAQTAVTQMMNQHKEAGHSYWRHPDYDSILDIWQDSAGIHFRVHSLNADNPRVRDMVAKDAKKDSSALTDADFQKAAGYIPQLRGMKQDKDGTWRGKIWIESRKEHFGIDIMLPKGDQKNLRVRGYIIEGWKRLLTLGNPGNIVGKAIEFTPVENPPPRGVNRNQPAAAFVVPPYGLK